LGIELKDIPSQYSDIVEFMGVDKFIGFCEFIGGQNIYIPTVKTLENNIRNKEILSYYREGYSIKQLSKKYNLTTSSIRHIVKNPR
ncbi:MAG: Mor transcription activator family protein, partial [Romboutsia sp.]|uniref:Mor transcription activator family protein n=1 Tax=Romboutsia sp. TaxID=1965302 RepID=UPI003F3D1444